MTTSDSPTTEDLATLKRRIDTRLNTYLVGLEPDCDDSIYGFNEAWDIVRRAFEEAMRKEQP